MFYVKIDVWRNCISVIKFLLKEKLMREIIYNFYKNIFIIKSVLIYLIVIGGWSLFYMYNFNFIFNCVI